MLALKTVCFSGYRPEKFTFNLLGDHEDYRTLESRIEAEIINAVNSGYSNFMCGMAKGFDLICGGMLLKVKQASPEYAILKLIAVPPYHGHNFSGIWGEIHRLVMHQADEIHCQVEKFSMYAYQARNRYMVDHSSRLICYYGGQTGGTHNTVMYARGKRVEVVNLFPLKS